MKTNVMGSHGSLNWLKSVFLFESQTFFFKYKGKGCFIE